MSPQPSFIRTDFDPLLLSSPTIRSGTTLLQRLLCSSRSFSFFRLFGDLNGNRIADSMDLSIFLNVLSGNPAYAQYRFACDCNGDGVVDAQTDFLQFSQRFGKTLP